MTDTISIRPLTLLDVEGAYRVFETTIPAAFQQEGLGSLLADIQDEITHKKDLVQASLQQLNHVNREQFFFLVATMEEQIVGTISYGPCGEAIRECTDNRLNQIGELGSLYVVPDIQGQGVASSLIQTLASELQQLGVKQFCLDSGYRIAQQKWQRKFGEPYAVAKNYWGEGNDHMVWLCEVKAYAVK